MELPNWTKSSAVYENVCRSCIDVTGSDRELQNVDSTVPAINVGETSRTILERGKEHWQAWRSKKSDSHIRKHQDLCHGGAEEPDFVLRAVSHHKSALSRQVAEAVRIMRRGGEGAVLKSRAEYNRSHIPRLHVEKRDEEEIIEQEQRDIESSRDLLGAECEQRKREDREEPLKELKRSLGKITGNSGSKKREQPALTKRRRPKKIKYEVIGELRCYSVWFLLPDERLINQKYIAF